MRVVREVAANIADKCRIGLEIGMPIERIQGHYFRRMHELAEEAEAQAILAIEGHAEAVAAIERCLDELVRLADNLDRERRQAAGDEPET